MGTATETKYTPSAEEINRLEKAAWDAGVDRVLVWERDLRNDLFDALIAARHQLLAVTGLVQNSEHRQNLQRAIRLSDSAIAKARERRRRANTQSTPFWMRSGSGHPRHNRRLRKFRKFRKSDGRLLDNRCTSAANGGEKKRSFDLTTRNQSSGS